MPSELAQRLGEMRRRGEVVERGHHFDPGIGRRQGELDLDHDAGGAVGVQRLADVGAAQLDQARHGLAGDDLEGQHRTRIAQLAVADRAHAGSAAADIAADGRLPARRREHAEFPALLLAQHIGVAQAHAGLEPAAAALDPQRAVQPRHVEQHAALQGHHLSVIPRGAAAHHQRDAKAGAGGGRAHDLVERMRHDDEVGRLAVEFGLQDRRIPVEVAAAQAQLDGMIDQLQPVERGAKSRICCWRHAGAPRSPSSSR